MMGKGSNGGFPCLVLLRESLAPPMNLVADVCHPGEHAANSDKSNTNKCDKLSIGDESDVVDSIKLPKR